MLPIARLFRPAIAAALCLLLASFPTPAPAADLVIEGPSEPVRPGELVQLHIPDLAPSKLPTARVIYWPRERVTVFPAQTWGGRPVVFFQTPKAGAYLVAVSAGDDYAEIVLQVGAPDPPPPPPPPPVPNPYQPAPEWKATVQPVLQVESLQSQPDNAKALAQCFDWMASSVAGGNALGRGTYGDLRSSLVYALDKQDLKGKVPGLGTALDGVLAEALGLDNVAIDRPKTAAVLRTVAWAIFEAGHGGATR